MTDQIPNEFRHKSIVYQIRKIHGEHLLAPSDFGMQSYMRETACRRGYLSVYVNVIYFEMPVEDMERAISFYENVFDWKITTHDRSQGPYYAVNTGDQSSPGINGSLYVKQEGWDMLTNVVSVKDIDKVVEYVQDNGGTIVYPKTTIKGVGYLAYFRDPDGNTLGIIQSDSTVDTGM